MKTLVSIAGLALAIGIAAPATAQNATLNVTGTVAPYCNIVLANVSSGTASVAMVGTQQVANLRLACNAGSGTKLTVTVKNGDLVNGSGNARINYGLEVRSTQDQAFAIAETDTNPNGAPGLTFTRSKNSYSSAVASGIPLELWLNMNVAVDPNQAPGSTNFPANAAPAGDYKEEFSFTASNV